MPVQIENRFGAFIIIRHRLVDDEGCVLRWRSDFMFEVMRWEYIICSRIRELVRDIHSLMVQYAEKERF